MKFLLVLAMSLPAMAQVEPDHVVVKSVTPPGPVKAGEVFKLVFNVSVDKDWHIYSANGTWNPPTWKFDKDAERVEGKVDEPVGHHVKEPDYEYDELAGQIAFGVPVRMKEGLKDGKVTLTGTITGQTCSNVCMDFVAPFKVDVFVEDNHTRLVSIDVAPKSVKVGEKFVVTFKLKVDPAWHTYSPNDKMTPTALKFAKDAPVEAAGNAEEDPPAKVVKEGTSEYLEHEGETTFRFPLRFTAAAKPGAFELKGTIDGQTCSSGEGSVCLPVEIPFSFDLKILDGGAAVQSSPTPAPTKAPDAPDADQKAAQKELQQRGFLGFILFAILGGLASLITPCVYPMLPITLTYFVKQGGESRAKSVAMSTAYALGIIIVFTGIGFLFSAVTGADGPRLFAANPYVNTAIALLFLWFAFSLFGLYEITLPSWLTGAAGQQRSGIGGAFILGSLFSIVTFTCVIPIAATVLAVAASAGAENRFAGLIAMLAYSSTMALPFFILGLFPSKLKNIPKSGGWLHTVKVTAAFAELALALMYLAKADQVMEVGVLTRPVMTAVWVGVLAMMALYLLGVFRMKGDSPLPEGVGVPRVMISLVCLILAAYMGTAFTGRSLGGLDILLPVAEAVPAASGTPVAERKFDNLEEALAESRKTSKPIFLEFTGIT